MKNFRWSVGAATLCVLALSAYGCSSDSADDDAEEDGTSNSGGKSSSGGKSDGGKSSSSGGRSSSSGGSSGRSSSSGGGNTSSSGGSSSGDTDGGTSSSSSGSVADGGTDGGGNGGNCTVITPAEWSARASAFYLTSYAPLPAGAVDSDLALGFYGPTGGFAVPAVGTYNLGTAQNRSYATCAQCILAEAFGDDGDPDTDDTVATFFQTEGSIKVTAAGNRTLSATLEGVKMIEVTWPEDEEDDELVPVPNGRCVTIADGAVEVAAVP